MCRRSLCYVTCYGLQQVYLAIGTGAPWSAVFGCISGSVWCVCVGLGLCVCVCVCVCRYYRVSEWGSRLCIRPALVWITSRDRVRTSATRDP